MSAVRGGAYTGEDGLIPARRNFPVLHIPSKRVGLRLALIDDQADSIAELARQAADLFEASERHAQVFAER